MLASLLFEGKAMLDEELVMQGCRQLDAVAQKHLYYHFAPTMLRVCMRYASNLDYAKDIVQEGFIKVFLHFGKFEAKGSLEGWLKRIMINTALTHYKKNKNWNEQLRNNLTEGIVEKSTSDNSYGEETEDRWEQYLDLEPLLMLETIQTLPNDFRMVFNMYFMEKLKHKEIAEILQIDEITSRTRLGRARKLIQQKIEALVANKSF